MKTLIKVCLFAAAWVACMVILAGIAHADTTVRVMSGVNVVRQGPMGDWAQAPLPYTFDNKAPAYGVELSHQMAPWLYGTVGLADRGRYAASGEYVTDPCYAAKNFTHHGCEKHYWGDTHGSTKALTFTLDPTLRLSRDAKLFAQVGQSLYQGKFEYSWQARGDCAEHYCAGRSYKHVALSPYLALGAEYRGVSLIVYTAPKEHAPQSIQRGDYGVLIGYAWAL